MRRTVYAALVSALAMLLSVALAVPAAADASSDFWNNPQTKPGGAYQYKYGYDYYKAEWKATPGSPNLFTNTGMPKVTPVSPTVNPSATGPAWYLNNYRNRAATPAASGQVLTGKIIEPGKTLVRPASTIAGSPKTVGGFGGVAGYLGRMIGMGTIGLGGTSLPPANSAELAVGQGVSSGCVNGTTACTAQEINKRFVIDSCGINGNCDAIGAKGSQGETEAQKWFREAVIAPLDDLWATLTGQKKNLEPSKEHVVLAPKGCFKEVGFDYPGTGQLGQFYFRGEITQARPVTTAGKASWDQYCSDLSKLQGANVQMTVECIDPATGLFANPSNGVAYGKSATVTGAADPNTGASTQPLCASGTSVPPTVVPFRIRFWNDITQNMYDTTHGSVYGIAKYSEWLNPDPGLNGIEAVEIKTEWSCQTSDGVTYHFSQTTKKLAAIPSPDCPPGSALVAHDISAKTPGGTQTIDAGTAAPGAAAAFPDCFYAGCAMQVYLDGTVCTVARAECQTWPAVNSRQPSRVVCKWGTYTVPTTDCYGLSNGYKTETGVAFDPRSGSWVGVDIYGNPTDANPEPWNPTNPTPVPGATPGTPPAPTTSTPAIPQTGTSPADGCVSPAWSWNPVEWVKNPVVCALKEAFVPKTDVKARSDALKTKAVETAPIGWVVDPPIVGPSGGGCPNWVVQVDGLSKNVVCDSSFTAAIVGVRGPMFGIVATAMMWPLLRSIWYALIPIVRVTPSGSK